jgi:hypothetical protein
MSAPNLYQKDGQFYISLPEYGADIPVDSDRLTFQKHTLILVEDAQQFDVSYATWLAMIDFYVDYIHNKHSRDKAEDASPHTAS